LPGRIILTIEYLLAVAESNRRSLQVSGATFNFSCSKYARLLTSEFNHLFLLEKGTVCRMLPRGAFIRFYYYTVLMLDNAMPRERHKPVYATDWDTGHLSTVKS